MNRRAEDLVKLQRKIAAYRQLQHDTTGQLYSVAAALLVPEDRSLDAILRQLNQFGYDLDRLQFVARDEVELLGRVRADYDEFIRVVTRVVELIRSGRAAEGRELQLAQATPLADRLERLTNQLVNQAEADMVASVDASHDAFVRARWAVIGFAVGAIGLALVLGFAISWSLVGAVSAMDAGLAQIASGDFSRRVDIPNRDELGALAANLNRMNDELGRLYRELEAASRHKSEFLANMSHELRTPLNAVIGFSEVLDDRMFGELNDKQGEYVRVILTSGRHLLSLINDILDLSKVEAGRMELELGTFNLRMALENALTLIRERATRHGLALGLDGRRDARGRRRRRAQAQAGAPEPAVQRREVHARGRPDRRACAARERRRRGVRHRHRGRHRARGPGGDLRGVPPGGPRHAQARGHRSRPRAGEKVRRAPRRPPVGEERGGSWIDVHVHASREPPCRVS